MIEFTVNNNYFLSTRLFSFLVSRGLHLYKSFDIVNLLNTITHEQKKKKSYNIFEAM